MAENKNFSHLPLPLLISDRKPKFSGGGGEFTQTSENKKNYVQHGERIKRQVSELSRFWKNSQDERAKENLPKIKTGIPILLEIDPNTDVSFLKGLGFEIVSELPEGYVIVSNNDVEFALLSKK